MLQDTWIEQTLSYVWYGSVGKLRSQLASSRTHRIDQDQNQGAADMSPHMVTKSGLTFDTKAGNFVDCPDMMRFSLPSHYVVKGPTTPSRTPNFDSEKVAAVAHKVLSLGAFKGRRAVNIVTLEGGTATPGLTSFGAPLGLVEIRLESSTNDGRSLLTSNGAIDRTTALALAMTNLEKALGVQREMPQDLGAYPCGDVFEFEAKSRSFFHTMGLNVTYSFHKIVNDATAAKLKVMDRLQGHPTT
ncbi:hypothetical protein BD769DRAFT_1387811 [Suillus cothurnatus]|nr:hypothetical protein BD769DRAFT_1387811 [Suillus cothurnatus]